LLTACLLRKPATDASPSRQTDLQPDMPLPVFDMGQLTQHISRQATVKQEGSVCWTISGAGDQDCPILQALCEQQEMKGHVMTACQLVDPGMGYAATTAANAGNVPGLVVALQAAAPPSLLATQRVVSLL